MRKLDIRTALVTGASAGLGAEFARQLAARGSGLILVARRKERLEALAAELSGRHGVPVEVLAADLLTPAGVAQAEARAASCARLDLLVNNAGAGTPAAFVKTDPDYLRGMVQVHAAVSVSLARAALPGMIARGRGYVINVASMAAFSPLSGPVYSANKAFLVAFSVNLQGELAGTGVRVQALCPGMTHTEFHDVIKMDTSGIPRFMWMDAPDVVRASLTALGRGRLICIPGWQNRLIAVPERCAPTAWVIRRLASLPYFRRKADV
ncbi:MAG TPA: SDR family oxidoreductase [Terriglobales bacterium]|nr:SDR family oxidoreductase [Terriglobales bacterium]